MAEDEGLRVRVAVAGSGEYVSDGAGSGDKGGSERAIGSIVGSILPQRLTEGVEMDNNMSGEISIRRAWMLWQKLDGEKELDLVREDEVGI